MQTWDKSRRHSGSSQCSQYGHPGTGVPRWIASDTSLTRDCSIAKLFGLVLWASSFFTMCSGFTRVTLGICFSCFYKTKVGLRFRIILPPELKLQACLCWTPVVFILWRIQQEECQGRMRGGDSKLLSGSEQGGRETCRRAMSSLKWGLSQPSRHPLHPHRDANLLYPDTLIRFMRNQ